MRFVETAVAGAFIVEIEAHEDDRGFFARTFSVDEFEQRGLSSRMVQASVSYNHSKGTLRGMHYQVPPAAECKLVRCTSGEIHDVIVDLRPDSPSYLEHAAVRLSAQNRRGLYVPECVAHGFQTLSDGTEVEYQISQVHSPEHARGLPYDDPAFGIHWPLPVAVISEKDGSWAPLERHARAV
jgi:dTDP-4-dehydrorhamnose 3,5-epimerase